MYRLTIAIASAALAMSPAAAFAEIAVQEAEYAAGVLVVRGETLEPRQRVTLDRRYQTRSGPEKSFRFRIRYLPADCVVDLRAGGDVRPTTVSNCTPAGAPVVMPGAPSGPS